MNKQDVFAKLEEIFKDLLDNEDFELSEEMTKNDIEGWDSLFHITLIATISDEFGVQFSTDDMIAATSISTIIDIISR